MKYRVIAYADATASVEVEAESPEEAREKAQEMTWSDWEFLDHIEFEVEVANVRLLC